MENNYFAQLNSINVSEKTEKKNGLTYLSWAFAWGEIKKLHPTAQYKVYENNDGWNYFTDGKTAWVKTSVTIENIEHINYLPIMNNMNKSIPLASVTSFDVNKAIQRSITKACAMHGLGLYIYAGEDLPESEQEPFTPPTLAQRKEIAELGGSLEAIAKWKGIAVEKVSAELVQQVIDKKRKEKKDAELEKEAEQVFATGGKND